MLIFYYKIIAWKRYGMRCTMLCCNQLDFLLFWVCRLFCSKYSDFLTMMVCIYIMGFILLWRMKFAIKIEIYFQFRIILFSDMVFIDYIFPIMAFDTIDKFRRSHWNNSGNSYFWIIYCWVKIWYCYCLLYDSNIISISCYTWDWNI